jgi:hypothetical protein
MPQGIKFRQFIAKYFFVVYIIFIMIGLTTVVLGGIFYYRFISAPSYSFKYGFSGFGIARNDTDIIPDMMVVGVGIDPPRTVVPILLSMFCERHIQFLFRFPF